MSMTFVANEMKAVTEAGCNVELLSLWTPNSNHNGHPVERPFIDRAQYAKVLNRINIRRMFSALITKPSVILTFFSLVPGHIKSPLVLAKLFLSLPKGLIAGAFALEKNVDIIHAHFLSMPTTVAMIASKVSGVPFTATAHAFDITSTHPLRLNGSVKKKCETAAAIVTISNNNVKDILSRWPSLKNIRLDVIYNGIDTTCFSPKSNGNIRNANDPLSIVSISNLNEKKGFLYLVKAVSSLIEQGKDVFLNIYGEGPERSKLEELIETHGHQDRITLHGSIDQNMVAELCKNSDLFVLASIPLSTGDADGLPTVLIESLGSSLPTISTQVAGIPEIIIDGKTGLCVPPEDVEALAQAIMWVAEFPAEANELAKNGRSLVTSKFNQKFTSLQLISLWNDCTNKFRQ